MQFKPESLRPLKSSAGHQASVRTLNTEERAIHLLSFKPDEKKVPCKCGAAVAPAVTL